ncbi:MAG TPA: dihydroneopterin aldolase, partial [Xanthomonadaceae bacterium]|nr:dihydroneopterin aldolase [Xanthomonadaceae bacterium]
MRRLPLFACLLAVAALPACSPDKPADTAATPAQPAQAKPDAIAWRQGDVDDALNEARDSGKPVLLYWGAVWCPPCNKLKATLFKDPAFVALTRGFVPVYLDGDQPGAQAWGERFGVRGYPTLIVLSPQREEITRLAGGNDSAALTEALKRAAGRRSSVARVLDTALKTPASLQPEDWELLADYGWDVDASRLAGTRPLPGLLQRLATGAPSAP